MLRLPYSGRAAAGLALLLFVFAASAATGSPIEPTSASTAAPPASTAASQVAAAVSAAAQPDSQSRRVAVPLSNARDSLLRWPDAFTFDCIDPDELMRGHPVAYRTAASA